MTLLVKVEVGGVSFDVEARQLVNSKVIQDLRNYLTANQPDISLPIKVAIEDWSAYLKWLVDKDKFVVYKVELKTSNNEDESARLLIAAPAVAALTVIDYLDDIQQARQWFEMADLTKQLWLADEIVKCVSTTDEYQAYRDAAVELIERYTSFTVDELLPFAYLESPLAIVARITSQYQPLTLEERNHLLDIVYNISLSGCDFSHFGKVCGIIENQRSTKLVSLAARGDMEVAVLRKFILVSADNEQQYYDADVILHRLRLDFRYGNRADEADSWFYRLELADEVAIISPRVADYYPDTITWLLPNQDNDQADVVMCPTNTPYLRVDAARHCPKWRASRLTCQGSPSTVFFFMDSY